MSNPRLIEGLVGGDDRYHDLYVTNAWFRSGIDQLVLMLPYFVAGLAEDAEEKNAEMRRNTALIDGAIMSQDLHDFELEHHLRGRPIGRHRK